VIAQLAVIISTRSWEKLEMTGACVPILSPREPDCSRLSIWDASAMNLHGTRWGSITRITERMRHVSLGSRGDIVHEEAADALPRWR